ncbi:MAG TPA: endonuclease/exonuclease/phosphatase family protein [Acidimicrobiales bacterium]|nr:endonuclease/exonuclease/phosphatase family protein [Acidimicrobiales bacterium]
MRIASFNVENLFARPKAMNLATWKEGAPVLAAHAELNSLLQCADYHEPGVAERILALFEELGLLHDDEGPYVRLRKIRGRILKRPKQGPVTVAASGRADWIGWVELKTERVDELAMKHTAMVICDVDADVMGVVEAESRPTLALFTEAMLSQVGGRPYEQVMVVDGNDQRGIDVGLLARCEYPLLEIRSHIFDTDAKGVVFSRDCCEYHLRLPDGTRLVVLVNHLKSKGYSAPDDRIGAKRRTRQATRIASIYRALREEGHRHIAVLGDLNDDPSSEALKPLLDGSGLRDISDHPDFDWGGRKGTFGSGNEKDKIDYVLLSPELYGKATGGAVFRKGIWRGPRTKNPWPIYETLTADVHAASDHAAIYAEIAL